MIPENNMNATQTQMDQGKEDLELGPSIDELVNGEENLDKFFPKTISIDEGYSIQMPRESAQLFRLKNLESRSFSEFIYADYLQFKMVHFGYSEKMVLALLKHDPLISLESAIEFMSHNDRGKWNHRFIGTADKCQVCSDKMINHAVVPANAAILQIKNGKILNPKECQVCYNEVNSYEELLALKCGHAFCEGCIREYAIYMISVGKVSGGICCPDSKCTQEGNIISESLLKRHLLPQEVYKKYQKFMKRLEIYKNPQLKGCPTIDCEGSLQMGKLNTITNQLPASVCCECHKAYCFKCLNLWHPGETCEEKIDKGYEEWANPNSENVGTCKNCGIKIEKEGGCPHMICQVCKHEWCWICKEDFPVHSEECPNYHLYLEILEFQGNQNVNIDVEFDNTGAGWFFQTGETGNAFFYFVTVLFYLLVVIPCITVFNIFITPVYSLSIIFKCLDVNLRMTNLSRNILQISLLVLFFIILYVTIPFIFIIVTLPQLFFHFLKKIVELKDLCKRRCRRYNRLAISPINNRLMRWIGLH